MAQFGTEEIIIGGSEWKTVPFRFNRMTILGGSGQFYINVLLSGVSPLALTKALGLNYIKALGKCEQNGTPTPNNPVNIVCNNGIIKVRNKSSLPLGYQAVEYLQSSGTQYIDTGVKLSSSHSVEIKFNAANPYRMFLFGGRISTSSEYYGIYIDRSTIIQPGFGNSKSTFSFADFSNQDIVYKCDRGALSWNDDILYVYTDVFGGTYNAYLFGLNNSGSLHQYTYSGKIYYAKIWNNGNLVRNLIPARRKSDDVLGMYDLVNNTFLTNAGTGDFTAGQDIDDMEIYTDGTQETVTVASKNLFDKNAIIENIRFSNTTGYVYNSTGDVVSNIGRYISDLIPVQVGNTYTKNTTTDAYHRVKTYDSNKTCLRYIDDSSTITIQENEAYIAISGYLTEIDDVQLELGSTTTTYEPYFNGGTANAEMLLKVGNYLDNQEILTGSITRNVGIKVFDGSENWSYNRGVFRLSGLFDNFDLQIDNNIGYSNYFVVIPNSTGVGDLLANGQCGWNTTGVFTVKNISIPSSADFKTWIANLYTNGIPLIVIYPLKTSTTETVTKQTLTAKDNCTVTATGSINNIELELSYKQST